MLGIYNQYDIILPKGSSVALTIEPNTPAQAELSSKQTPGLEGYKFDISYFKLTVPDGIEANIIVETEKGKTPLFPSNISGSTTEVIDASDFDGLHYLNSFTLYAKVDITPADAVNVILEYSGKLIVPYVG